MDVKFKKVVVGFAGAIVVVASVLFWPNDSHKVTLRETATAKQSTYQSKVMPVEKFKKGSKEQSTVAADLPEKILAPVINNHQAVQTEQAADNVKTMKNILNIKLKKESSIVFDKTAEKAKSEIMPDLKITALKLKRSTAIHLAQTL